jgi:hypothetical protein
MKTEAEFVAEIKRRGVPVGSHLVVERRRPKLKVRVYTHHGIYLGNYMVAHYSGEPDGVVDKGEICRTRIEEFAKGDRIGIRRYEAGWDRDEVLRRVREMESTQPDYHLLKCNCEHFATYCVTGDPRSKQASAVVWFGLVGHLIVHSPLLCLRCQLRGE